VDIIYKGIKARWGHLHRYPHAAAEVGERHPPRDSAAPAQRATPETAGPVSASSFASVSPPRATTADRQARQDANAARRHAP
jgi:hypothetical protein